MKTKTGNIRIEVDFHGLDDREYDFLLSLFERAPKEANLDPKDLDFDEWRITCVARPTENA